MSQKNDVRKRYEQQLLDQRAFQRVGSAIDQLGTVVKRNYPHARRQSGLQRGDLLLNGVDDFERVDTVARYDYTTDSLNPILIQDPGAKGISEFHIGYVFDINGCPI